MGWQGACQDQQDLLGSAWGDPSFRDGKTPGLERQEHPPAPSAHIKPSIQLNSFSKHCKRTNNPL